MQPLIHSIWWPRLATLVLGALAAGSVVFWGLKLPGGSTAVLSGTMPPASVEQTDPLAVARLLGAGSEPTPLAPAPNVSNRFVLTGVVAGRHGGAALISVDGKPARPYRVGAVVEQDLVLQSVAGRSASLAANMRAPAAVSLELPPLRK